MKTTVRELRRLIREAMFNGIKIPDNPDPNCPECGGTGLYHGFTNVEACQTCSARGPTSFTRGEINNLYPEAIKALDSSVNHFNFNDDMYGDGTQVLDDTKTEYHLLNDGGLEAVLTNIKGKKISTQYDFNAHMWDWDSFPS